MIIFPINGYTLLILTLKTTFPQDSTINFAVFQEFQKSQQIQMPNIAMAFISAEAD